MQILIVGAGIAGLTTALTLHDAGIPAVVIDQATDLRPLGVGINLLPHATAVLDGLGLAQALSDTAIPTSQLIHTDRFGNEIWRQPRGLAAGHRWPQYSIHRGALHSLLLAAARDRLAPTALRTGMRFRHARQYSGAVHSLVHDRRNDTDEQMTTDAVIGADGLHSTVRGQLHPDEGPPKWNGIRMWRGVTATTAFLDGRTMVIAGSNHTAKFVAYPLSRPAQRRNRSLVNWVAEVRTSGAAVDPDWNRTGHRRDVAPHYTGWRFFGVDVEDLITASDTILEYPMVDRDPLPSWTRGRITLLGDAAHPMYPIGSNGASQAILDAHTLATELAATHEPVHALHRYDQHRRPAVNPIVLANRDMPLDHILHTVTQRAPHGFHHIRDVLTDHELHTLAASYDHTSSGPQPLPSAHQPTTPDS